MYDVVIIGGGVVGCCIARELSKRKISIAVLEKAADIGEGASKANSGIVHAGYDAAALTLKARLNVRGNKLMGDLADELDFPYRNNGSLVLDLEEDGVTAAAGLAALDALRQRGRQNGVAGLEILSGRTVRQREPAVSKKVRQALYAPTGGIVCPFGLTVAMAENAAANGVEFHRATEVAAIERENNRGINEKIFKIKCQNKYFESRLVVNAAGLCADAVHKMVSEAPLAIRPRRGEYLLYDKNMGELVSHTLFQLPTARGKGVLVAPTVHGNLLIGPTAEDIDDKAAVKTTGAGLRLVMGKAAESIDGKLPAGEVITSFAGLRAVGDTGDFIIKEAEDCPGFLDVAGIDSPGLTAAPAIGEYVAALVGEILPAGKRADFIYRRRGISPGSGEVICRCETVTREAVQEAIRRTPGAVSVDGIKRRVRAGMGRCQGGFCSPRIAEILARELGKEVWEITKAGAGSEILINM